MKRSILLILTVLVSCHYAIFASTDDKEYFTVTQSATAASPVTAKQKAMIYARNTLASMVNGKVTNVAQSYLNNNTGTKESSDEFLSEIRLSVNMLLKDILVSDESVAQERKGGYTAYVTLKLKKSDLLNMLCSQLLENEQTKTTFQKEVFTDLWMKNN